MFATSTRSRFSGNGAGTSWTDSRTVAVTGRRVRITEPAASASGSTSSAAGSSTGVMREPSDSALMSTTMSNSRGIASSKVRWRCAGDVERVDLDTGGVAHRPVLELQEPQPHPQPRCRAGLEQALGALAPGVR